MSFRKKKKSTINQFNCPWLVMNPGSCKSRKNVRVRTERGPAARARSRCVPCGHHCLCRRCSHFRRSGKPVWGCEMQSASQCPMANTGRPGERGQAGLCCALGRGRMETVVARDCSSSQGNPDTKMKKGVPLPISVQ